MARKEDLLAEAAELGIEGVDESTLNATLEKLIAERKEELEGSEAQPEDTEAAEAADVVEVAEDEAKESQEAPEPVFDLAQLRPYSESVFGCGWHVLVGARSAGFIPEGRVTKEQVRHGIDQYLNMPVEHG